MSLIIGARNLDALRMLNFNLLDHDQQQRAIRDLSKSGQSDHTIATATGLAVEQVRRILAEPQS